MIDLHTHTTFSDGKLTPQELVVAARSAGITQLAVTDHDNDEAFKSLLSSGSVQGRRSIVIDGLTLVNGVEFSTRWNNIDIHVLGLNYFSGEQTIESLLTAQAESRAIRNLQIREKLHAAGVDLRFEELDTPSCRRLGRVYFADKLVAAGLVKNTQRAFTRYLGQSKRAFVKSAWADLGTIITAIRAAEGSAILAHPLKYKLSRNKLRRLVFDFKAVGGEAIEVISGKQVNTETQCLVELANAVGLKASLGSDFHAVGRPWGALGVAGYLPKTCTPVWRDWTN